MTAAQSSILFFLQMAGILATCRVVGWIAKRFLDQPQLVGEMIAGVVLGPSLLSMVLPGLEAALFPPESRKVLYLGAKLGVGLYLFIVCLTFDRAEFLMYARAQFRSRSHRLHGRADCRCGLDDAVASDAS